MAPICALRGSIDANVYLVQRPFKHRERWSRAISVARALGQRSPPGKRSWSEPAIPIPYVVYRYDICLELQGSSQTTPTVFTALHTAEWIP